jgi:hypothetical protein
MHIPNGLSAHKRTTLLQRIEDQLKIDLSKARIEAAKDMADDRDGGTIGQRLLPGRHLNRSSTFDRPRVRHAPKST